MVKASRHGRGDARGPGYDAPNEMDTFFGLDNPEGREVLARETCFLDCEAGRHLDLENGVVSVCKSSGECQGWRAYLSNQ